MPKSIAIDFDGTLCTNKYPHIGEPQWGVIKAALKAQQIDGAEIILWTCREGELLEEALAACEEWGLVFDAVNESTKSWQERFGTNPRKVGADEYWDDKSVWIYDGVVKDRWPYEDLVLDYFKAVKSSKELGWAYYDKLGEVEELQAKLKNAENRIKALVCKYCEIPCEYCEHNRPCGKGECEYYDEETIIVEGKEYPWSCFETEWGDCRMMRDTPCRDCKFEKYFKWNGK